MKKENTNLSTVGILGCGWLGFPLAKFLVQSGYQVAGTTTSPVKIEIFEDARITGSIFRAGLDEVPMSILNKEILIIAFPPKSKSTDGEWYRKSIQTILCQIRASSIKIVILISSTSVYPEIPAVISEDFELNIDQTSNPGLFLAEKSVLEYHIPTYILRFGGLTGGNRLLAKHFAGKRNLKNGNSPVNLIHIEDAVGILYSFISEDFKPGVYNACSPLHPKKKVLYTKDCERFNLPLPEYEDTKGDGKEISVKKLLEVTKYKFKFPDPETYTYG